MASLFGLGPKLPSLHCKIIEIVSDQKNFMVIEAKNLNILWGNDPENWEFVQEGGLLTQLGSVTQTGLEAEILDCVAKSDEAAHLKSCHHLVVCGGIRECELVGGQNYQVSFIVKGRRGTRTDNNVTLMIQSPGKGWLTTGRNIPMDGEWTEVSTEKVRVSGSSSKVRFYMVNTNNTEKNDLYVRCAIIKRVL